jgi:hypothetical protein
MLDTINDFLSEMHLVETIIFSLPKLLRKLKKLGTFLENKAFSKSKKVGALVQ